MMANGVEQFSSVAIWGFNAPEWFLADLSAVFCGAKAAGIYPTDTPDQAAYKVRHSDARVCVVEDNKKVSVLAGKAAEMPDLKAIVVWGEKPKEQEVGNGIKVFSWEDFKKCADQTEEVALDEVVTKIKPGHCCTLIYTSGTTGFPKAVMISHDNIAFEASSVLNMLKGVMNFDQAREHRIISYLPLSHIAGTMVDIVCPVICAAMFPSWITVHFARPTDLKEGTIGKRLVAIQPTMFIGVPRVWEKIAEKMKAVGASIKGMKKKISTWGKRKGLEHARNCSLGGSGAYPSCYGLASKIIHSKAKAALGLDQCLFGFTGAAPITVDTLEYFGQLGIQINEVYGMSECTGATTWSLDEAHVWGSCGFASAGTEVKIFKVSDTNMNEKKECPRAKDMNHATEEEQGEICFRGRHIMMGYLANPKMGQEHVDEMEKKTAAAIDSDGWLHSGDKGCMSEQGMVKITGRYKELIMGAGGENIAPVPIEDNVKKLCPFVSNIMMVGDKQKYNTALITLKCNGATGEEPGGSDLIGSFFTGVDPNCKTFTDAEKSEAVKKAIQDAIDATNKDTTICQNNAWKIQKFKLVNPDFSVSGGELTATLKLKRQYCDEKYKPQIDEMYGSK
jgi:long-chain-fatty-acid--CoA ligase ACSBG